MSKPSYIVGISAFYHDSAAAIIKDGIIIAAAQEERFTRKKHDENFPINALNYCLEEAGIGLGQVSGIAFYDKPLLKFERLLETYYAYAPKGISSFMLAIPVWLKEKMFLKKLIHDELAQRDDYKKNTIPFYFPEHHLSHAASAFYPSPFEEAAILTIDGVGEHATISICSGKGKDITIHQELRFPHSLGLLYSAFTYFLGFKVNSGEYKLMGLAPYGNPDGEEVKKFKELILANMVDLKEDGSVWLNQKYFNYATGLTMARNKRWEKLFGIKKRMGESELEQVHCNLGLAIQQITEEAVLRLAKHAKELTGLSNLCMAGGVALNCVANGVLHGSNIFDQIFIQPAAGDAGGAIGAAQAAQHIFHGKDRTVDPQKMDAMSGSYLGPDVYDKDVVKVLNKYNAQATHFENEDELCKHVAGLVKEGNIIGWMQGRMEFGPRALGNRSIIGDPGNEEMQKKLNLKIKYRESFRPFAPSVLAEDCHTFFEHEDTSPYMLMVKPIQQSLRKPIPSNYNELPLKDKLYVHRSTLPSITHIDFSARIQTVHKETNPRYYNLIEKFKNLSGYGVMINTSFNVRGEPIVCTPEDAYRCFMRTEMDYLAVGDYVFKKETQPEWTEKDNWQETFTLD